MEPIVYTLVILAIIDALVSKDSNNTIEDSMNVVIAVGTFIMLLLSHQVVIALTTYTVLKALLTILRVL